MNRAERRRAKKNGSVVQAQKTYTLTQSQLDDMIVKAIELKRMEILEMVSKKVTNTFILFCLDVLHSKFGFGVMKLKRFKYFMDELAECVEQEYCTTDDILEALKEEVDLDFMYRKVQREECYNKKHWGDFEQVRPFLKDMNKSAENENNNSVDK